MKKSIIYGTFFILFIVLLCPACDDYVGRFLGLEPKLPPATSTEANTFGCYVNGDLCLFPIYYFAPVANITYGKDNNILNISFVTDVGRITLRDSVVEVGKYVNLQESLLRKGSIEYISSNYNEQKGNLFLSRFDTVNHVISGLFSFKAKSESGDSVVITEGRFDMNRDYFSCYPNTEDNNIIIQQ